MKNLIFKIIGLAILVGSFALGWLLMDANQFLQKPLQISEQEYHFEVGAGESLTRVSRRLHAEGVLEHPRYLVWYAKLMGNANTIKTGEYRIKPGTRPGELLDQFVRGDIVQYAATIIEGWNIRELLRYVTQHPNLDHTLDGVKPQELMSRLGYAEKHPEGLFLPDTYHFPRGTSDVNFLKRAYEAMQTVLETEWTKRKQGLPLKKPYDALILASIVEKETAVAEERQAIAGVFIRRLQKRMRLQTDPTVIYGLGEKFDGNIRRRDLVNDTPYNTYRRYGLPPTPIAMPGIEAIRAALNPDDSKAIYFVARGDGSHAFSETLDQHNKAVIKYQLKGKKRAFSSMPATKKTKNSEK